MKYFSHLNSLGGGDCEGLQLSVSDWEWVVPGPVEVDCIRDHQSGSGRWRCTHDILDLSLGLHLDPFVDVVHGFGGIVEVYTAHSASEVAFRVIEKGGEHAKTQLPKKRV